MISTIARFILDPFNILLFLIAGAIIFKYLYKIRVYKWLFWSALLWFFLITTPYLSYFVLGSLENRYDPLFVEDLSNVNEEYHIVVLGAGYMYDERFPANTQLNQNTLGRLVEGVRLYHQLPNSRLIASGPYSHHTYSQAEVVRETAILLGVPDEDILIQSEPGNTREEADIYYEKHYTGQTVIVVTNASHMPRALAEFQRLGITAIPSPTNYIYKSKRGMKITFIPSSDNISHMRTGMFEYAALVRNYFRK